MENIFTEISLVIVITAVAAGIFRFLRQPLIIAYIVAGILLGPVAFDIVKSTDAIGTFSQLGIVFLLFMVGLNLDLKIIKSVGKISLITGLGQILFTSLFGFLIAQIFAFGLIESLYIALALTFSSTIIIMKLLSDKKDLESVYGRISVGFLIVQDLVAMLILMFVSSTAGGESLAATLVDSLWKGTLLGGTVVLASRFLLPAITRKIADQQELLILFCIAWCFALAGAFHFAGFSIEIGALLAGVSLASSSYRFEIAARVRPLRDFFILMFFVYLGAQMEFANFSQYILPIVVFSLFILIGNPLIVMILMGAMGYKKRTGFLAGLTVAQISEFSLILVALGVKLDHLDPTILSFVTIVGLITIGGSTYFIIYGKKIYQFLAKYLSIFERQNLVERSDFAHKNYDVLLLGYNHIGSTLASTIRKLRKKFLVVDYDPDVIANLNRQKIACLYGDLEDADIFDDLNIPKTKMIVSTVKDFKINREIVRQIRAASRENIVVVVSENEDEAVKLYDAGASYVVMPHLLGGHHVSTIIETLGFDFKKFMTEKLKHLDQLKA